MNDYSLGDGFGEVIEAMIKKQSPLCNKNLKELNLPKSIRIASILRDGKIIIPNSNTNFNCFILDSANIQRMYCSVVCV